MNVIVTTTRDGQRAYVTPLGSVVKDGAGRMAWSVYYEGDTYAEAWDTTLRGALSNIAAHVHTRQVRHNSETGATRYACADCGEHLGFI